MKLFSNIEKARASYNSKQKFYINSECPFRHGHLCGSWCSLFYYEDLSDRDYSPTSPYVILGCKGMDKRLYISEVVDCSQ